MTAQLNLECDNNGLGGCGAPTDFFARGGGRAGECFSLHGLHGLHASSHARGGGSLMLYKAGHMQPMQVMQALLVGQGRVI